MDLLQSFMGCMYPGSIRTDSMESIDYDYSDLLYQATNIDEEGGIVSKGELHLNYSDLIYYRAAKIPTRWPLNSLRRYGVEPRDNVFIFEAGRGSPRPGIFAFRLNRPVDLDKLFNRLKEMLQQLATNNELSNKQHDQNNQSTIPRNTDEVNQNNELLAQEISPKLQPIPQQQQPTSKKKDASISTEGQLNPSSSLSAAATATQNIPDNQALHAGTASQSSQADPKPLSYVLIDFDTTKALNESAQAHAASRQTQKSHD